MHQNSFRVHWGFIPKSKCAFINLQSLYENIVERTMKYPWIFKMICFIWQSEIMCFLKKHWRHYAGNSLTFRCFLSVFLVRMTWTLIDMLNFGTLGLGKGIPPRDQLLILFFSRFHFVGLRHSSHLFFNRIVSLWNQLPLDTRSSVSFFSIFKTNAAPFLKSKFDSNFETNSTDVQMYLGGRVRAAYYCSRDVMVLEVIRTCSSHALHWYLLVF